MPAIKLKKVTAEYLAEKEKAAEKEKSRKTLEDNDEEGEEEAKPYNFLDVEVLWDKRKRTVPVADQKLIEWLDTNLEAKTDVYLPLLTLYEYYSEVCQMQGTPVIDVPVFNRYIRDKFGKFFGFQENSPYKALIKERKRMEKKPKIEGESGQLKIRDIIREVIETAGNPRKGLRYSVINKAIMTKYPAHRIGMTPRKLKAALERGIYFGHIHLVRGVGMCGYYRLPGEPTIEEKPEKGKDEEKAEGEEGGETAENGAEDSAEMGESTEKEEKTGTKRKADSEADDSKDASPRKKQKKKSKKKKQSQEMYRSEASRHSDPQRVEDAFPLAITYQSDPKECSVAKIRNYISKYYHVDVNPDRLKSALEKGVEKGLWEVTKGSGVQGTYHLLIESFNPARSDNLGDQISQALVACHEPKSASVGLIKKYITQYHPNLNIEAKPHLLKAALERATKKGAIRQLSGVGASGSFQLVYQFSPSPAILAGDQSDEEEEEDDGEEEEVVQYKPRPTKRGRIAERKLTNITHTPKQRGRPIPKDAKKGKSKAAGAKPFKRGRKSASQSSDDDDDDEVELTVEEYTPRKTKSRGGSSARATPQSTAKGKKSSAKPATPAKKDSSPQKGGNSSKKVSGKPTSKPASPKKGKSTPKKKSRLADSDDEGVKVMSDEDEPISDQEEYIPKPSKRRGGGGALAEESLGKGSGKKQSSKSRRK